MEAQQGLQEQPVRDFGGLRAELADGQRLVEDLGQLRFAIGSYPWSAARRVGDERITGNRSLRESRRKRLGCGDDAAVKTSFRQERTYAVRFRPSRKRRC